MRENWSKSSLSPDHLLVYRPPILLGDAGDRRGEPRVHLRCVGVGVGVTAALDRGDLALKLYELRKGPDWASRASVRNGSCRDESGVK